MWRLPILFYKAHLGWLLGDRFLLLIHTGRVSGETRQAVLEVIRHDKAEIVYYVASGFGEKSDWFRKPNGYHRKRLNESFWIMPADTQPPSRTWQGCSDTSLTEVNQACVLWLR